MSKPFHESVVEIINHAVDSQMSFLAEIIKVTKIPIHHQKILEAWQKRLGEVFPPDHLNDFGVPAYLKAEEEEMNLLNDERLASFRKSGERVEDVVAGRDKELARTFLGPRSYS